MILDLCLALDFFLLVITGLILEFFLPAGYGIGWRRGRYGFGTKRLVGVIGCSRLQWREVHFWLALVMIPLVIVHLCLHWDWIRRSLAGTKSGPERQMILPGCENRISPEEKVG